MQQYTVLIRHDQQHDKATTHQVLAPAGDDPYQVLLDAVTDRDDDWVEAEIQLDGGTGGQSLARVRPEDAWRTLGRTATVAHRRRTGREGVRYTAGSHEVTSKWQVALLEPGARILVEPDAGGGAQLAASKSPHAMEAVVSQVVRTERRGVEEVYLRTDRGPVTGLLAQDAAILA